MNILMKMYQGSFVIDPNNIGHEWINLIKADDGKFYIWLNANGSFSKEVEEPINIIMVRTLSDGVYSIIAKAVHCKPVKDYNHLKIKEKKKRRELQKEISYKGKKLTDIYKNENDNLVTFETEKVYKAKENVYVTNDTTIVDNKMLYQLDITAKSSMRQYFDEEDAKEAFDLLINNDDIWEKEVSDETVDSFIKKYVTVFDDKETMFSILRKESDECSISNSLAYFLEKYDMAGRFLGNIIDDKSFEKKENYEVFREKGDIDLLFIGENHLVIVENKIYSKINGQNSNKSLKDQVDEVFKNEYVLEFLEDCDEKQILNYKEELKNDANDQKNGNFCISQLSKYYFIALLIAKIKNINKDNIHCFLLVPNFSKAIYSKKIVKNLFYNDKYKIICYSEIFKFFDDMYIKYHDVYFEDFLDEIKKYAQKSNCIYESNLAHALKQRFDE